MFADLLSDEAVKDMEEKRGVQLSPDQRKVLQNINTSSSAVQTIAAHAGTGKTLLSGFLLGALVPQIVGEKASVLILTPGRLLRDHLVESEDCVGPFAAKGEVLWLGRDRLWENYLGENVEEKLTNMKKQLHQIEETMKQHHGGLMNLKLSWKAILDGGDISVAGRNIRVESWLQGFKHAAQSHMVNLIMTIVRARAKIICAVPAATRGRVPSAVRSISAAEEEPPQQG